MAAPRRVLRLQQLILETVASFVQRELRDPRIGMVSITRVQLAPDLSTARIGWSCLGDESQHRTCERGLEDATGAVQRAIAKTLSTRVTPKIQFKHDGSMEEAQKLEEIFHKLHEERVEIGLEPGDGPADAPDEPDEDVETNDA